MKLSSGTEFIAPLVNQLLLTGELLVIFQSRSRDGNILDRYPIIALKPGIIVPNLPHSSSFEVVYRAIEDVELLETNELSQDLFVLLSRLCSSRTGYNFESDESIVVVMDSLWSYLIDNQKTKSQSVLALTSDSTNDLFIDFEEAYGIVSQSNVKAIPNDPLEAFIRNLISIDSSDDTIFTTPSLKSSNPRQYLLDILNLNGLVGRDIILEGDIAKCDHGNFVAFFDSEPSVPVLFSSLSSGYQVWAPSRMESPQFLESIPHLLGELNPRAISINTAFKKNDLTSLGLLRFTYGKPSNTFIFIFAGLFLGLAIGFLLAIGKEVGAARWIFGFGVTGTAIGASLGFLSGGFRVGVGAMMLATLLGLLTPTFNTVITNQALPDRDFSLLLQISGILIAAGIFRVALEWTQSRSIMLTQQKGANKAQLASFYRLLSLPVDFYRSYSQGDLQLRYASISELRTEIQGLLDGGLFKAVLTSIYVLFLLKISVKLTLLAFVISLFLMIPTAYIGYQNRPLERKKEDLEGEATSRNLEIIGSVSKLRLAGAEARAAFWWSEKYKRTISIEGILDVRESVSKLLQEIIPNLGNLLLYIVITKLIAEAALPNASSTALNAGQLLGFFSAFGTFIGSIVSLADLVVGSSDIPIIYERASPILTSEIESSNNQLQVQSLSGKISFDRVSYRYAPHLPLVLDSVSFDIEPGQFVAIVGPSGSGKSTIVRMLLAFANPEDGTIFYDNQPLSGLRVSSVRSQIGTVLQSNALFAGTIFEAIAGGVVVTLSDAWDAAKMAGVDKDIKDFPMGMQTVISEGGGSISGGQKQRIAIARALVRRPRILIFDEATSALDNHTQAIVSQSLEDLCITRIVIAHRLSTIRNADLILVMESGIIKQSGTYETLMKQQGLFSNMMQRQVA